MRTTGSKNFHPALVLKVTPLLFGNDYYQPFHAGMEGQTIKVREVDWPSAYYEVHGGGSILKTDVELLCKLTWVES